MSRGRRRAWLLAVAIAASVAAWAQAPGPAAIDGGAPRPQAWSVRLSAHELRNPGFVVGYSEWHRQPLWVAYAARAAGTAPLPKRPHFTADERTLLRVASEDYRDSGYDRGHLAPNYLIGKLYGPEAQRATFLMSNIAPQRPRLNSLVWQRLEEAEADAVAPAAGELWVITGPVFGAQPARLKSGVTVPAAFFRIWLDRDAAGAPRVLGFVVPQEVCGTEPLSGYLASVAAIEARTGLDFLRELDDALEQRIESAVLTDGWNLPRFDRLPPRYADRFGNLRC